MNLLRCLECYLQVTEQQLDMNALTGAVFSQISNSFMGALASGILVRSSVKGSNLSAWLRLMDELKIKFPNLEVVRLRSKFVPNGLDIESLISQFKAKVLNEDKVWLWRGWVTKSRDNVVIIAPLYPIYNRLGRKFTQLFFEIIESYCGARKCRHVPCLRSLALFIGQYPSNITPDDFLNPGFMGKFWRDFFIYFVTNAYSHGSGARLSTIVTQWRNHFLAFISDYLIPSGLFVESWGALPSPEPKRVSGANTNIICTDLGHEVKSKLLTHIPLHVSDEEAIHLLFKKIEEDFRVVTEWAAWSCNDIWERYERRIALSPLGSPRVIQPIGGLGVNVSWLTDRNNPDHLRNACATFALHGFQVAADTWLRKLYPVPITQTAVELALPVTDALLPHCFVLVANHPEITPSFLENLEVYDKNGKIIGFVPVDGGYKLISHKGRRNNPNLGQQIVTLNSKTIKVVQQMLILTNPIRDYLRNRNDDQWRFLLLTCPKGFGYPQRVRNLSASTSEPSRKLQLVEGLGKTSELSLSERTSLIERTSLPALRASAGVLIYLKTMSAEKMSKALGHATYSHRLLEHYLPKPILEFFQDRWVRIFQTGIIVEAMKESPYLLEAANFSSMDELHEFLSNHALFEFPQNINSPALGKSMLSRQPTKGNEIIFGVNSGILTALISLEKTVNDHPHTVDSRAIYWAGISAQLVKYIESSMTDRADLQSYLEVARKHARPFSIQGLLHGD